MQLNPSDGDILIIKVKSHDQMFKMLITTFFWEFVELFLPHMLEYLDRDTEPEFLDKEILTDIGTGERHEIDLLVKVKFKGEFAYFLIHIENQSTSQPDFPRRMFGYCSRIISKYDLPVYPIALFSYDSPKRAAPDKYTVSFSDLNVIQFEFRVIQLNRLSWRDYINKMNPVAVALMAKMNVNPEDRARLMSECMRMLVTLKLSPARTVLIGSFLEQYLKLSAQQMKQFERVIETFPRDEQEAIMEMTTTWFKQGKKEGEQLGFLEGAKVGEQLGEQRGVQIGQLQGKAELLYRQISYRFGAEAEVILPNIPILSKESLDELGLVLFEVRSLEELKQWIAKHSSVN